MHEAQDLIPSITYTHICNSPIWEVDAGGSEFPGQLNSEFKAYEILSRWSGAQWDSVSERKRGKKGEREERMKRRGERRGERLWKGKTPNKSQRQLHWNCCLTWWGYAVVRLLQGKRETDYKLTDISPSQSSKSPMYTRRVRVSSLPPVKMGLETLATA